MELYPRLLLIGLILTTASCSKQSPSGSSKREALHSVRTQPVSELVMQMGEPDSKKQMAGVTGAPEFYLYQEKEFQVEGEMVVSSVRLPRGDEIYLQYWLQKLQGYPCEWNKKSPDLHEETYQQYKCAEDGLSLVYDPQTDRVIKVVEYEGR